MSASEAEGMARKLGLKLYRCCSKENLNVTEPFLHLIDLEVLPREKLAAKPSIAESKSSDEQIGKVIEAPEIKNSRPKPKVSFKLAEDSQVKEKTSKSKSAKRCTVT